LPEDKDKMRNLISDICEVAGADPSRDAVQSWVEAREIANLKNCLGAAIFVHPLLLLGSSHMEKSRMKKSDLFWVSLYFEV
jgi:hypothetical protein